MGALLSQGLSNDLCSYSVKNKEKETKFFGFLLILLRTPRNYDIFCRVAYVVGSLYPLYSLHSFRTLADNVLDTFESRLNPTPDAFMKNRKISLLFLIFPALSLLLSFYLFLSFPYLYRTHIPDQYACR